GAGRLCAGRPPPAAPTSTPPPAVTPTVVEICRRLDGIPLALELAAARVRHLSPAEIARRLDDRFRLLTGGPRGGRGGQQTLAAAPDWGFPPPRPPPRGLLPRAGALVRRFSPPAPRRGFPHDYPARPHRPRRLPPP